MFRTQWLVIIVVIGSTCYSVAEETAPASNEKAPLCKPFSEYIVRPSDLNKPVSPCNLYFHVDAPFDEGGYKHFRVIIRRGKPFQFDKYGKPIGTKDQLLPYCYEWKIRGKDQTFIRSWSASFIRNRDGTYHTVIEMPLEEWNKSVLDVYFEDVDGDGEREDVTYRILVGEILKQRDEKEKN